MTALWRRTLTLAGAATLSLGMAHAQTPDLSDPPAIDGEVVGDHGSHTLRMGIGLAESSPQYLSSQYFADILDKRTEGRITVGGRDLRDVKIDSWAEQYAIVTQEPFLFHASIEENIGYGKPGASDEEIRAAAEAANIRDFVEGLPGGYATNVADAGTRLSGGQRQRITIARAVLHGAPLILLDEATSALDTESEAVVQAALANMLVGHTAIVIAHRLSTVRDADRIAVLEERRLVELGTHEELLARGGLYARLHAAQFAEDVTAGSPN